MNSRRSKQVEQTSGFTLIELLVAITIFIILTTLAIGTFNLNIGNERIRAASRIVQAKFEGARSRSFGLSQQSRSSTPIGVRFVLDDIDPTLATGLIFVEGVKDRPTGYLRFVDLDPGAPEVPGIQFVSGKNRETRTWLDLLNQGLLRPGVRITIDDKYSYTISSQNFLDNGYNNTTMTTVETLVTDSITLADPSDPSFQAGSRLQEYEFDLSTIAFPMADEEVELLPPGTVVDLGNSAIPSQWSRISAWVSGRAQIVGDWVVINTTNGLRYGNAIVAGTTGSAQPDFNVAVNSLVTDGGVTWRIFDRLNLDIMFNPNGSVNGPAAAEGVLNFLLAEKIDTDRNLDLFNSTDLLEVKGSYRVMTLYTNSGTVLISPANLEDADSTNGVDDLFLFARQGSEAR